MTDEVSAPPTSKPRTYQFVIAIAIVLAMGFIVILIFAASPRVANALTAGGTISLAGATVWLGLQTRDAVLINEREMDQNKDLLELTRQQADSATQSDRILSESSRPFVVPQSDGPIWVGAVGDRWNVTFHLANYGSSIAILEVGERRPKLLLAREGDHVAYGTANSLIIPKESGGNVSFSIDPKDVARAGGSVMRPDGTYIAAALTSGSPTAPRIRTTWSTPNLMLKSIQMNISSHCFDSRMLNSGTPLSSARPMSHLVA